MLAFRNPPIVASSALSGLDRTVVVARPQEGRCTEVAAFARRISHDMSAGFRCRHDAFAERMAAFAVPWRVFEYAPHVAGLTCSSGVSAGKREAGSVMVEIAFARLVFGNRL